MDRGFSKVTQTYKDFYSDHAVKVESFPSAIFEVIEVLEFLKGRKWDDIALAYCTALNPTYIRVTTGIITLDARVGRITVYIDSSDNIYKITQETRIKVGDNIRSGEHLRVARKYGIDSEQAKWYEDDEIEAFCHDGINDRYYKKRSNGEMIEFPKGEK